MINLSLKAKKLGAATLLFAVILLVLSTLIVIFASQQGILFDKSTANIVRTKEAYEAAEAGIEFGMAYFQQNASTIVGTPINGYINFSNASTTNVTLANNSRFSVVYTNPIAFNYNLILITSTGTNSENSATRILTQEVQRGSLVINTGTTSVVTKGSVIVGDNAVLNNTSTNQNIRAASTVSFTGNGKTVTSSGMSSNFRTIGPDVQSNVSALANTSQGDFFASYFGTASTDSLRGRVAHYYNNTTNKIYNESSSINGLMGTSIWIDQAAGTTVTLAGDIELGSVTDPVLLIVNGGLSVVGNVVIHGFIFVIGSSGITSAFTGNNEIIGGLATTDNLTISGNSILSFNPTVLTNLRNHASMTFYAKVPGSWKDF